MAPQTGKTSKAAGKLTTEVDLTVVIPCYNEVGAIESTIHEVFEATKTIGNVEVIVVDDGSTDGSREILRRMDKEMGAFHLVEHARNQGYGAALKTGVRAASGRFVAITDADATYPNHRLPDLFDLAQDADMVVGARTGANVTYSTLRKIPKFFMVRFCMWITQRDIPDMNSGLRVFKTESLRRFLRYLPDGFSFTTTITIAMMTNKLKVVYEPIDYAERAGQSKIKPIQDTLNFFRLIIRTGLYFAPMRVFGPAIALSWLVFAGFLVYDIAQLNLSDKTLLFLILSFNLTLIAALADMIDKRLGD